MEQLQQALERRERRRPRFVVAVVELGLIASAYQSQKSSKVTW
jgi:hypothetical protein